jgi:hypothetical protein
VHFIKGRDDISSSSTKHLLIFLPDLDILQNMKEQQLLGKNYFKYSKFLKISGYISKKTHALKWMLQIQISV